MVQWLGRRVVSLEAEPGRQLSPVRPLRVRNVQLQGSPYPSQRRSRTIHSPCPGRSRSLGGRNSYQVRTLQSPPRHS